MKTHLAICLSLTLSFVLVTSGASPAGSEKMSEEEVRQLFKNRPNVTVEKLKLVMKTENVGAIRNVLNDVGKMRYPGEILLFLKDVWDQKREEHPTLSWKTINKPIVRVAVAAKLLRGRSNRVIELNPKPIQEYLRKSIDEPLLQVRRDAIMALEPLDDPDDVPKIYEVALREKFGSFRSTILALNLMCNDAARTALKKLRQAVRHDDSRAIMDEFAKSLGRKSEFSKGRCEHRLRR